MCAVCVWATVFHSVRSILFECWPISFNLTGIGTWLDFGVDPSNIDVIFLWTKNATRRMRNFSILDVVDEEIALFKNIEIINFHFFKMSISFQTAFNSPSNFFLKSDFVYILSILFSHSQCLFLRLRTEIYLIVTEMSVYRLTFSILFTS